MYQPRDYRNQIRHDRLEAFRVTVKETDLHVQAEKNLEEMVRDRILYYRGVIEGYLAAHPGFGTAMVPWQHPDPMPKIVYDMVLAGQAAHVGPMAAVAGAMAEYVGTDLLSESPEVIVENGGDIFLKTKEMVTVAVYAGSSPLNLKIGIRAGGKGGPIAVCTSSGTIGHSVSFGIADAVCVVASSSALADAAATAIGNKVISRDSIEAAIQWGRKIPDIKGILVIIGDKMGAWGPLELVPIQGKKG